MSAKHIGILGVAIAELPVRVTRFRTRACSRALLIIRRMRVAIRTAQPVTNAFSVRSSVA